MDFKEQIATSRFRGIMSPPLERPIGWNFAEVTPASSAALNCCGLVLPHQHRALTERLNPLQVSETSLLSVLFRCARYVTRAPSESVTEMPSDIFAPHPEL
jgi:hypothetical protein